MDKEKILAGFNQLAGAQRSNAITVRLILLVSLLLNVIVVFFSYRFAAGSASTKLMVDASTGQYMKFSVEDSARLFNVRMETHCANAAYYINSFDRLTIVENQARSVFIVNKSDAVRIFERYRKARAYTDAIDRGISYRAIFLHIDKLEGQQEPYKVKFSSKLTIYENADSIEQYLIKSEGTVRRATPQYPENTTGLYFSSYSQTIQKITANE